MGEAIGKSGPSVDITQNLGDPCAWQHAIQPNGKVPCSVRDGRLAPGDVEFAILDLSAVEFAARSPSGYEAEAFVQSGSTARDVAVGVGLIPDADVLRRLCRQEVVLEGAVVAAAGHPNVAALQPIAQRGEHGGLVEPPVRCATCEDQLAPPWRQERCRRSFG